MPVVITCYETPRDAAPPTVASETGLLFRAAAALPSRFGYVELTEESDSDAAIALARRVANGSAAASAGSYAVFHSNDRAADPFSTDARHSSIMFVNCLECPPDREDATFAVWHEINAYMVTKPGYRWHKLHRRTHPDAPFGFVNVVEWESAAAWQAAHDDGFRALAASRDLPFTAYPTLCEPIEDTAALRAQ